MAKGKHAAASAKRTVDRLTEELAEREATIRTLGARLQSTAREAAKVSALVERIAALEVDLEAGGEVERQRAEVRRLKGVNKALMSDYEAALEDFYVVTEGLRGELCWDRPTMHEYVVRRAPHVRLPGMEDDFVSTVGVQHAEAVAPEGRERIQRARGHRA